MAGSIAQWNTDSSANEKGAKIPWNDPEFSSRMLENHLSQEHDWASRRKDIIDAQVAWLARQIAPSSQILDMGCGPGLYTQALAKLGHQCVGVDFSPASIAYAQRQATENGFNIEYALCDIREYKTDKLFDCILMTFGEFNVFTKEDATNILENCAGMLREGGMFILETHTFEAVQSVGTAPASWQRYTNGLFSSNPHLCYRKTFGTQMRPRLFPDTSLWMPQAQKCNSMLHSCRHTLKMNIAAC